MSDAKQQQRKALKEEVAWKNLEGLFAKFGSSLSMKQMFAQDANRFAKYSQRLNTSDGEILFDFSKNIINEEIINGLLDLVSKSLLKYTL